MPEGPSLASLHRYARFQGLMICVLAILSMIVLVASLREVYRVEKKVDALTAQMEAAQSEEAISAQLKKLEAWADELNATFEETKLRVNPGGGAVGNSTDKKAAADITGASVIVLTKWKKADGMWKCIVAEVLRQNEKMPFGLKSGDEFPPATEDVVEGNSKGAGVILFFKDSSYALHDRAINYFDYNEEGNPFQAKVPSTNGPNLRIPSYDHMPVQRFKEIVAEQK